MILRLISIIRLKWVLTMAVTQGAESLVVESILIFKIEVDEKINHMYIALGHCIDQL